MKTRLLLSSIPLLILAAACGSDSDPAAGNTAGTGGAPASSGTDGGPPPATSDAPTWHQDVAPLVGRACVGCHNQDGVAPFSMEQYELAAPFARKMADAVASGAMPPWLAHDTEECVPRLGWKYDVRLTAAEKALLAAWADADAPEGDPTKAAPAPAPTEFSIPDPDLSLTIPTSVEIDGDRDQYWCFILESGLTEKQYFDQIQITAGNDAIVHHVLVYNDQDDRLTPEQIATGKYECFGGVGLSGSQLVTAWAPGGVPNTTPKDVAYELDAGTRLVLQVHYHPIGTKQVDSATSVQLKRASGVPLYRATTSLIGNFVAPNVVQGGLLPGTNDPAGEMEFKIPAGAKNHVEQMTSTVSGDMIIYGMGTHMHYVGRQMEVHLERPSPGEGELARECLIATPAWDFNWQRGYQYDAPLEGVPVASAGDRLLFKCTYDNSLDNPFVREALKAQGLSAPRDVFLGEQTLDEMCLGAFAVATPIEPPTTP